MKQFPIRLYYGMTINKSQGQTLDIIDLFLFRPLFTHDQLYVVVSRATSRKRLKTLIHDAEKKHNTHTKNIVYKEIFECLV